MNIPFFLFGAVLTAVFAYFLPFSFKEDPWSYGVFMMIGFLIAASLSRCNA